VLVVWWRAREPALDLRFEDTALPEAAR
jgi:hypothetical protein